ncbi:MAG TPA: hypothetical protein DHN29_06520, partial [Cytophagales bacterium]|nr:hypothetical protein [Cytophagales bacterium]
FPITVLNSSGVNESIADNDALANVILADLNSCDEGDEKFGLGTGSELGKLKLFMTDAPYPIDSIESAYVRITEILMKYESGDARDFVLTDSIMVINIFELRNGVTETLTDTLINPGTVSGFSLIIDSAVINLKDGRAFDLKVPSGAQSGVKVKLSSDLEIIADEEVNVLLDFDLSKSFVPKGNDNNPNGINGFNFKPVLRAINLAEAGLITGQIFDASDNQTIEGVTITLNDSDGEFYASTFSEVSGSYALMGIDPGTYTLVIEKEGYILQEQSVTIIAQETLTADFELVID